MVRARRWYHVKQCAEKPIITIRMYSKLWVFESSLFFFFFLLKFWERKSIYFNISRFLFIKISLNDLSLIFHTLNVIIQKKQTVLHFLFKLFRCHYWLLWIADTLNHQHFVRYSEVSTIQREFSLEWSVPTPK